MSVHENLLIADFQECFQQMRHYDDTFRATLSFGFSMVLAVEAASGALVERYGFSRLVMITVGFLLITAALAVTLLVGLLARNRVYFAFVVRYVNEIRGLYLAESPGGILNRAGWHSDYRFPQVFNPASTQSIQVYFLLICSSFLLSIGITALLAGHAVAVGRRPHVGWFTGAAVLVAAVALQAGWLLVYWTKKGRCKDADTAVFGDRR
jgi:hypothetical protein